MGGKNSGGRNRKPTAIKKLQGNAGKRKLNAREPKPLIGRPAMPSHLSKIAVAAWKRLVPILTDMKVLTVADGDALGAYCSAIAQWAMAEGAIAKYGILLAELDELTGTSVLKTNPAVRVKSDALRHMRSFEGEFGLTPASRSKLQINADSDDVDPFEAFLTESGKETRKPN
jgi:P27 family predicted phage terminase small subunit